MFGKLRHLWQHHPVALTLFGAAAIMTLLFVVRLTLFSIHWSDPAHRRQLPESWMTVGYVAHSWHLPIEDVQAMLDLPDRPGKRLTLAQIAEGRGVPVEVLIAELTAYLQARPDRP